MASFYGNMKNNSRASFIFDRIYPTRYAMDQALVTAKEEKYGDGVFINRYVLVNYRYVYDDTPILNVPIDYYYEKVNNNQVDATNYSNFYKRLSDEGGYYKYSNSDVFDNSATYYQKKVFIDKLITDYEEVEQQQSEQQSEEQQTELVLSDQYENPIYREHRLIDLRNYSLDYDLTVWMKVYLDGIERYILVADLKANAPGFEVILDAPGCPIGGPHIDPVESTERSYVYYAPKSWGIQLNQYNPSITATYTENTDEYWRYEQDQIQNPKTFDKDVTYPYFNQDGLNPQFSNHKIISSDSQYKEGVFLRPSRSNNKYPKHIFRVAGLITKEAFVPNRYFEYKGPHDGQPPAQFNPNIAYYKDGVYVPVFRGKNNTYVNASGNPIQIGDGYTCDAETEDSSNFELSKVWQANIPYYELVQDKGNERTFAHENDTQRVDIYLPSFGNAVADIYDVMYGQPATNSNHSIAGFSNFVGYCTAAQMNSFNNGQSDDDEDYRVQNGIECVIIDDSNNISTDPLFLTSADLESLSIDSIGNYINPVYAKDGSNVRPYSASKLLRPLSELDNLNNYLSLGTMTTELKKQLSILNSYITNNANNRIDVILKGNWTESDNENGIGYILNKPQIINKYIPTSDTTKGNKKYYRMEQQPNTGDEVYTQVQGEDLTNITNPQDNGLYELFTNLDSGSGYTRQIFKKVADDANYDQNAVYYNSVGQRVGNVTTTHAYRLINDTTELKQSGNIRDIAEYDSLVNGNEINGHIYYLQAVPMLASGGSAFYSSGIYLFHDSKPVDTIKITKNGSEIWTDIVDIASKSREDICSILNAILNANDSNLTVTCTYQQSFSDNASSFINESGFCYIQYSCTRTITVDQTYFNSNKNSLYLLETEPINPEKFEIHEIWNDMWTIVGQE